VPESLSSTVGASLVLRDVKIYTTPEVPPIDRGSILIRDGRIAQIGDHVSTPNGTPEIPVNGCVVTSGFWNAHVHFTEGKWTSAGRKSKTVLNDQLRDMFTSRGFTTVVDTGSYPPNTFALRRRIESGELVGPSIYTAGAGIYPPKGIPYYVRSDIPFWVRPFVPQPSNPAAASRIALKNLSDGADLVKLFTGSYVARGKVTTMPVAVARAAADVAHAQGRLVYSHPSNLEGTRVAIASGVDVLAHPPDTTDGVDRSVLQQMVDRGMSMVPTLKMFATTASSDSDYLSAIYEVVRQFQALGGQLLFGTDVGYMRDYSTEDEFGALVRSGVDARGVLRMLTSGPARRFGVEDQVGSIAPGCRADLTILESDPMTEILGFTQVRATIRGGKVLYVRM
jgi:imidazolonepropionase-like amidohydrolase